MKPVVDVDKCTGCESCHEVCPADPNVFEIKDGKAHVVEPDACVECGACEAECPQQAITLE